MKGIFHHRTFLNHSRYWAWLLVLLPFAEAGDSLAGVDGSGGAVVEFLGDFTPRDCPVISDDSVVTARVTAAPKAARPPRSIRALICGFMGATGSTSSVFISAIAAMAATRAFLSTNAMTPGS